MRARSLGAFTRPCWFLSEVSHDRRVSLHRHRSLAHRGKPSAERPPLPCHSGGVDVLRFSADGKQLLSGDDDGKTVVWDADVHSWRSRAADIVQRPLHPLLPQLGEREQHSFPRVQTLGTRGWHQHATHRALAGGHRDRVARKTRSAALAMGMESAIVAAQHLEVVTRTIATVLAWHQSMPSDNSPSPTAPKVNVNCLRILPRS